MPSTKILTINYYDALKVLKFNNHIVGKINNYNISSFNNNAVMSGVSSGSEPVITDLTGTDWVFNEVLNLTGHTGTRNVSFASPYATGNMAGEEVLNKLVVATNTMTYYSLSNSSYQVYSDSWVSNSARVITITGGTDATNANLIAFLQSNAVQKDLISFSIRILLGSCYAEDGMTREEYVSSVYNKGFYLSGNYVKAGQYTILYNGQYVLKTDTIISGASYGVAGGGSND